MNELEVDVLLAITKKKNNEKKALDYFDNNSKHIAFTVYETDCDGNFLVRAEFGCIDWNIRLVNSYCKDEGYLDIILENIMKNISNQYFKAR